MIRQFDQHHDPTRLLIGQMIVRFRDNDPRRPYSGCILNETMTNDYMIEWPVMRWPYITQSCEAPLTTMEEGRFIFPQNDKTLWQRDLYRTLHVLTWLRFWLEWMATRPTFRLTAKWFSHEACPYCMTTRTGGVNLHDPLRDLLATILRDRPFPLRDKWHWQRSNIPTIRHDQTCQAIDCVIW